MHHNALLQAIYKQSKNVLPEPQSLRIPSYIKKERMWGRTGNPFIFPLAKQNYFLEACLGSVILIQDVQRWSGESESALNKQSSVPYTLQN